MKICIFFCTLYIFNINASPWIINENHHRYIIATNIVNNNSYNLQKIRFHKIITIKKNLEYFNKLINDPQLSSFRKKKIQSNINSLKHKLNEIETYHNNHFKKFLYEYGVNNHSNIGLGIFYNENQTYNNNFYASVFCLMYKYQLLQKNNLSLSLISEIFIDKSCGKKIKYFYETSFALGKIQESKFGKFIFSNMLTCKYDFLGYYEYNISNSQSIKFKNNIMLTNFNKYTYIPDHNILHNKILYQELSIAKEIEWKNISINLSIGYFWHKSLVHTKYQTSGIVLASIWDF
jgi:hypothetical protein